MKNQYIKSFFTQTIQFIIIYVIFHSSTSEPWFQNKLRDTIVLLISYLLFMVLPLFDWIFRPIKINVKQENKLGKAAGNTQMLFDKSGCLTPESQRTVNLTIEITRRGSIWWKILLAILKRKELSVVIEPVPNDLLLQGRDFARMREVEITEKGFFIKINSFLLDLSNRRSKLTIAKSFPYFVTDHPDIHIPHNLSASVQPIILVNGKKSFFINFFVNFAGENHQIFVFRR